MSFSMSGEYKLVEGGWAWQEAESAILCQAGCAVVNRQTRSLPSWSLPPSVGAIQLKQGNKYIITSCESGSVVLRENKRGDLL